MQELLSLHLAIVIGTIILIAITEAHEEWANSNDKGGRLWD